MIFKHGWFTCVFYLTFLGNSSQECRDKQLLKLTIARGNVPLPAPPQAGALSSQRQCLGGGSVLGHYLGWALLGVQLESQEFGWWIVLDKDVRKWIHIEWKSDLSIKNCRSVYYVYGVLVFFCPV